MVLFVLGLILLIVGLVTPKAYRDAQRGEVSIKWVRATLCGLSVPLMLFGVVAASYYSVPAGHRGVLFQFGAIKGILGEGANWVTPFIQKVEVVEVRVQKAEVIAQAASKDLQTVKTELAVNFHIEPAMLRDLYLKVGPTYNVRIIQPAVQETLKAVTANYTAEELIRKRAQVKSEVDELLSARLRANHISVEPGGVSLTDFDFSEEFNKAIENKQVAQQSAERQKYVLQQAKLEAETAIATAEGRAKAAQIEAAALNSLGGSKVLAQKWIEKWDGKLPMVGQSSGMMIDIRSLMDPAQAR